MVFETSNVDLATYLLYEGMELEDPSLKVASSPNKKFVIIRFKDPKGQCRDLETTFLRSEFKKFRELNKWLLSKIHQKLK